jgi:hypothetical protein
MIDIGDVPRWSGRDSEVIVSSDILISKQLEAGAFEFSLAVCPFSLPFISLLNVSLLAFIFGGRPS